jgi:hypothetical protein
MRLVRIMVVRVVVVMARGMVRRSRRRFMVRFREKMNPDTGDLKREQQGRHQTNPPPARSRAG